MSDTPETNAALFDAFDGQGGKVVFADFARKLERQRDRYKSAVEIITKERDEAREALRVLFKDYKELADSGDAGFWELEDKEAAQPALRILQQREAAK